MVKVCRSRGVGSKLYLDVYMFLGIICWSQIRQVQIATHDFAWQVSSFGRVRNSWGQVSYGSRTSAGYYAVSMTINGTAHGRLVHRLVCRTFLGAPPTPEHDQVNHRNGNKSCNHLSNLEYVTASQNNAHAHGMNSNRRNASALCRAKAVLARRKGSHDWTKYPSMSEASRRLGISVGNVWKCCHRKQLSTCGHEFMLIAPSTPAVLPGEQWRDALEPRTGIPIRGWPVSSAGRVKTTRGIIHWGHLGLDGYRRVMVGVNCVSKSYRVHQIVARTFLGPPLNSKRAFINHKDCNRSNNVVENLEYVTAKENQLHSFENNPHRKRGSKGVRARRRGTRKWTAYPSMSAAAHQLGIYASGISECCSGKLMHYKDYEFELTSTTMVPATLPGEEWRDVVLH